MTKQAAIALAQAIVNAWDNYPNFETEAIADDTCEASVDAARSAIAQDAQYAAWFAPVLAWQSADNSNDYTMDEACEVLRAFIAGRKDCDVLAILRPCEWAMQRTRII